MLSLSFSSSSLLFYASCDLRGCVCIAHDSAHENPIWQIVYSNSAPAKGQSNMLRACRHSLSSLQIKRAALLSPGLARPLSFGEVYWRLLADLANLFQLWIVWKHQGQNIRTLKCGANLWHASRSNYAHNLPIISSWLSKAAAHYAISAWDCPQGKFCKWTSSECSS